jgi:hypothetical protein
MQTEVKDAALREEFLVDYYYSRLISVRYATSTFVLAHLRLDLSENLKESKREHLFQPFSTQKIRIPFQKIQLVIKNSARVALTISKPRPKGQTFTNPFIPMDLLRHSQLYGVVVTLACNFQAILIREKKNKEEIYLLSFNLFF